MKTKAFRLLPEKRQELIVRLAKIIGKRPEVQFVYLYGSFREDLPFHDIDLGIYIADFTKEDETVFYALDLSHTLSRDLGFPDDVRVLNAASIPFLFQVIKGDLIFEKKP